MSEPTTYTRRTLAQVCGISESQVTRHAKANTLRLRDARHVIPGVGVQYHAGRAARFIQAMQAKHSNKLSTHIAV